MCLPHLLTSPLVESARPELGVAYKGDIQNVQWLEVLRTGFRITVLNNIDIMLQVERDKKTLPLHEQVSPIKSFDNH